MPYKVSLRSSFKKKFGGINIGHQNTIKDIGAEIANDPSIGEDLSGAYAKFDIKYFKVKNTNPQYRILYKKYNCNLGNRCEFADIVHDEQLPLKECLGLVEFILVASREDFNNYYSLSAKEIKAWVRN